MKNKSLRVLIVEDSEDDTLLLVREIDKGGYNPVYKRVDNAASMAHALRYQQWDIILCDYTIPRFSGLSAIALFKEIAIDIPFIIVSGTINGQLAVECMRLGARDYITKSDLSRLCPAIVRELKDAEIRKNQQETQETLRKEEQIFKVIIENSFDIFAVLNVKGSITYVNPTVEQVLGFKPEERIGRGGLELVHPDDKKFLAENFSTLISDTSSPALRGEVHLRHKDGSWRNVEVIGCNLVNDDKVEAVIVSYRDITERKLTETKLQETFESFRKAVGITIKVLVSVLETRDPYTSGHQDRTAALACAIATEMGLDSEKIEGIRMAGIIHDIGKLSVPAEILTKPSKLTDLEYSLIKAHPEKGSEMIKDIESPWPLAQVVQQHHERMNGTGYPRNLKGDDILLEARILAVADVVEAMGSYRPYRPSLGIEAALEEIEKNKGILYDNTVADACLKLFREKGYQIKQDTETRPVEKHNYSQESST